MGKGHVTITRKKKGKAIWETANRGPAHCSGIFPGRAIKSVVVDITLMCENALFSLQTGQIGG